MQSTQITRYHSLPCHARDVAEAEFVSKVIPEWSSFSSILRQEYELVGAPIDWSLVNSSHLPPVENHVANTADHKRHLTSLQETYKMKPVAGDPTHDRYFTVYFYVVSHWYTTAQVKNYSPGFGFKVGNTLSELNELNRSIEMPIYITSSSATAVAIKSGKLKIMLTQDLVSLSYEGDENPNQYGSDMWFCGTGDPVTGLRNKTILGSTLCYSTNGYWSMGADSFGRIFDDTVSNLTANGGKGARYNTTRAILPNGTITANLTLSMLSSSSSTGVVMKNLSGTETILPGPYWYGDNILHSNCFYKTPFYFTYSSEASPGSRQVIDGVTYFGSTTTMYNTSSWNNRKYYQPMVREFPA